MLPWLGIGNGGTLDESNSCHKNKEGDPLTVRETAAKEQDGAAGGGEDLQLVGHLGSDQVG